MLALFSSFSNAHQLVRLLAHTCFAVRFGLQLSMPFIRKPLTGMRWTGWLFTLLGVTAFKIQTWRFRAVPITFRNVFSRR